MRSILAACVALVFSGLLCACGGGGSSVLTPPTGGSTSTPTQPSGLTAVIGADQISLSWTANTDGLTSGYRVIRDGVEIGVVAGASFMDTHISGSTTYSYAIVARSASGGESAQSVALSVSVPARLTLAAAGLLDGLSSGIEQARDVAIGPDGSFYVVGGTSSPDFPVTTGAYDASFNLGGTEIGSTGPSDAFIAKLTSTGALVWATYLGGPNYDRAYAVEVAPDGSVVVAGRAGRGFPTTPGTFQTAFGGDVTPNGAYGLQDGFIAKLSADGRSLMWATYFGGNGAGVLRDMDVAANGEILVAGSVNETLPFISTNAAQTARRGTSDAVFARITSTGSAVLYATYVGGSETGATGPTGEPTVRSGPNGSAYFLTFDNSSDFSTTTGAIQARGRGGSDFILERISATGQVDFATYLGGSRDEFCETHCLAVDGTGKAYIGGYSHSSDFPTTSRSFQPVAGSVAVTGDAIVAAVSSDGRSLVGSSYLGGNALDGAEGISVRRDSTGAAAAVVITGSFRSTNLLGTPDAFQSRSNGGEDGVLAEFSPDLSHLRYMTFFGGSLADTTRGNAVAGDGTVVVVGQTSSTNAPLRNAFDTQLSGAFSAIYGIFKR